MRSLTDEFSAHTDITTDLETIGLRNRLDDDARIALYRIAQEALSNVERHASADRVEVSLLGSRKGAVLRIADKEGGMVWPSPLRVSGGGLGLRNMQERVQQLGGTFTVTSSHSISIEAQVPLSHMLRPDYIPHKESTA